MNDEAMATPETNAVPPVAPEILAQIRAMKDSMIHTTVQKYFDFIQSINALPADQFKKHTAFIRFDEGMMWFKEAILAAQFQLSPVDQAQNAPQENSVCENPTAEADGSTDPAPSA